MLSVKWSKVSLFFLFSVACIGTLLRGFSYVDVFFEYQNLVHAHSHIAFQGWVYTIMFLLLINLFIDEGKIQNRNYKRQFIVSVFVIVGVLISFSVQGYGLYSIIFSSLFQLLNYWFIISFFKDTKTKSFSISLLFVKTGLLLGALSTIAPWGVGILSAKGLKGTEAFDATIYFFLHFQYNGWFLFVTLGLFFKLLENNNVSFDVIKGMRFYLLFTVAVVPAYTLSLLGMSFRSFILLPAVLASLFQLLGLYYFLMLVIESIPKWESYKNQWSKIFLYSAISSFFLKVILQLLSTVPLFENYAFGSKNLVLAYLHLSLIGFISFLLISILIQLKWLKMSALTKVGSLLLIVGYIGSEFLLVITGLGVGYSQFSLFLFSAFMAIGFFCFLISKVENK